MKLLYAEDERTLSEAVADILTYHNYIVDAVYNGEDAYDYAVSGDYDGIILDIMMPKRDGLDVLSALRKSGCKTPVLLLTAKTQVSDRIRGLNSGADDYLPKPFAMGELLARVRAMLRRREEFHPDLLSFGDLTLNVQSGILSCNNMEFALPKQEYRMMEQLMANHRIFLSSEDLLQHSSLYGSTSLCQPRHGGESQGVSFQKCNQNNHQEQICRKRRHRTEYRGPAEG